jgi:hypothetical protein
MLVVPSSFDDDTIDGTTTAVDIPRFPMDSRGFILFVVARDFLGLRLGKDGGKLFRFVYVVRWVVVVVGGRMVDFGDMSVVVVAADDRKACGCCFSELATATAFVVSGTMLAGVVVVAAAVAAPAFIVFVTALI